MNKENFIYVVVLFFLFAMTGCATYVSTYPMSIAVPSQSEYQKKIGVMISQEDLEREEAVGFGIAGFFFPVKVKVGEMLKVSASDCFSAFFRDVTFGDSGPDAVSVVLKIEEFYIFGIDAKAHLKLLMTITNKSGEKILEESYAGEGSGHFPMYLNEANQRTQVSKTTEEAFQMVFDEIARDVGSVKFASSD